MSNYENTFLYVGPTGFDVDLDALGVDGLVIRPPVRRGDIHALLNEVAEPGRLIIVDGTYFSFPAVGHIELRQAIEAGWEVWGICSMGAVRAYEMRNLGMRGYGRAYQSFFEYEDFQDDEVALLHGDEPPYLSMSEPLLHLRGAISELLADGRISKEIAEAIVGELKAMWFGKRTLPKVRDMLAAHGSVLGISEFESLVARHRIKRQDFLQFFETKPWLKFA
ncbi:TfuA-like protein [Undibacterium terreum]|uniref:TfuA-like protein n=1 Tax=Undibacterium terreum TaxID=1224302 RepID=UPI001663FD5F|nr:TfuA-like protein [Undibacterium terreum]